MNLSKIGSRDTDKFEITLQAGQSDRREQRSKSVFSGSGRLYLAFGVNDNNGQTWKNKN